MKIKKIEVGSLGTNCYVLLSDGEVGIIDPGGGYEDVVKTVRSLAPEGDAPRVKFIVATHYHWDHVDAIPDLVDEFGVAPYLSKKDARLYRDYTDAYPEPSQLLEEGDEIVLGSKRLVVWETPGHSPGSITLAEPEEKKLFVGDLIFAGGFGRTDLPGGSSDQLKGSLARIVGLDENWTLYPGHGPITDIQGELERSPFLRRVTDHG